MSEKRKVFAPLDKEIFREILKKYAHIIENKKTDAVSNKDKEKSWMEIAKEFNGCTRISEPRTGVQLKKLWQNMKTMAREQKTKQRQNTFGTGGGPPEEICTSLIDDVEDIAPHLMTTVTPVIDSDMLPAEQLAVITRVTENSDEFCDTANVILHSSADDIPEGAIQILTAPATPAPEEETLNAGVTSEKSSGNSARIKKRRNTSTSSWSHLQDVGKYEAEKRTHRQIIFAEQDKELFGIRKSIALTELSASKVRLEAEILKKELIELELLQKKKEWGCCE